MLREQPLRRLDRALRVPARRRLLLLEEIGADYQALLESLAARGVPEARARRLAARRLLPGRAARADLEAAYRTPLRRWLPRRITDANATAFLVALTVALGSAAILAALWWLGPLRDAGAFSWLLVAVALPALANWGHGVARIVLEDDLRAERRGRLLRRHAGFAIAGLAVASLGVAWEAFGLLAAFSASAPHGEALWSAVARVATLGAIGLGVVATGLLSWLLLVPKLLQYERTEARIRRVVECEPVTEVAR